jgi:gentisate 1,2-dioxygenase
MPRYDLRTAAIGDRVEHEFLVRDRAEKMTKAGMPFVVLTLANASATAPAFVFIADESPLHRKLGVYENRG